MDVLDLELLMSYWEQPFDDSTLIAHWALDETEGAVAYDSAGINDASLVSEPLWQPEGARSVEHCYLMVLMTALSHSTV
jgi:hypothetical protein